MHPTLEAGLSAGLGARGSAGAAGTAAHLWQGGEHTASEEVDGSHGRAHVVLRHVQPSRERPACASSRCGMIIRFHRPDADSLRLPRSRLATMVCACANEIVRARARARACVRARACIAGGRVPSPTPLPLLPPSGKVVVPSSTSGLQFTCRIVAAKPTDKPHLDAPNDLVRCPCATRMPARWLRGSTAAAA